MLYRDDGDSSEPRRRKLDELFADEPFLSTTMKARRLHEKLLEAQNGAARQHEAGQDESHARHDSHAYPAYPPHPPRQEIVEHRPAREPLAEDATEDVPEETPTLAAPPPLRMVSEDEYEQEPVYSGDPIPFEEAAAFLRASWSRTPQVRLAPAAEARLLSFRDRTLTAWLREGGLG